MTPELKTKWVSALRSGDYIQGRGELKQNVNGVIKHCCLGVLCEVMEDQEGMEILSDEIKMYCTPEDDDECSFVTNIIVRSKREQIGMSQLFHNSCWRLNDVDMCSFAEIADYIERNDPKV